MLIYLLIFSCVTAPENPMIVTPDFAPAAAQDQGYRKVKIIVPSITCFSRFRDSLKIEIAGRHTWIRHVEVTGLGKRVLVERPKFDFGNDVTVTLEIESDRTVAELARLLHSSRLYTETELWVLESGHKMNDLRNIPFRELLQ